jgi:hypothetical protein
MDVLAGGQVHHRVAAPADRPGHFVDFLLNAGSRAASCRCWQLILTRKLRPMIIGSDSGWLMLLGMMARPRAISSRTNSGRDHARNRGAETLAGMLLAQQVFEAVELLVFADRHVFHFRGDDAGPCVVHLRHIPAGQRAARLARQVEAQAGQFGVQVGRSGPLASVFGRQAGQFLGVITLGDPGGAQLRQALADVDAGGRVGIRAGAVIDRDRRIRRVGGRALGDLAHRHADVGAAAVHVNLA